ncbi:DUF6415 family natural product biosynthesis protein [Streptomyces sp. NPDC048331]|uniref:DUF6415 family natural product biosynthesis protein n=1 Tax=Streptomyces sp. NPDC048331 TaxID=3365534 RepID=UPI003713B191
MTRTSAPTLPALHRTSVASQATMLSILPGDVAQDVEIALALAAHAPHRTAAVDVRARLRAHIAHLVDPAEQFADTLPEGRARDIAASTVRHARDLIGTQGGNPAACLTLLAKLTQHLAWYAADPRAHGTSSQAA